MHFTFCRAASTAGRCRVAPIHADRHAVGVPRPLSRRLVLASPLLALAGCAAAGNESAAPGRTEVPSATHRTPTSATTTAGWVMPDEAARHAGTWMAFGASTAIWGAELVAGVRKNLADIANAIVQHEPVTMLVRPNEHDAARALLDPAVRLHPLAIDDLWVRDTGPAFVARGRDALGAVGFNFNGWGGKQSHADDARVAAAVTAETGARPLSTTLTLEGGAIEVDGLGTAILTESCVLNDNRNPGWTKGAVEAELARVLGIRKVIWLPGISGQDITDGHTDFYARFAGPGRVVAALDEDPSSFDNAVTHTHLDILNAATSADGSSLAVTTLTAPRTLRQPDAGPDFAAGYVNFYVCNGAVIAPQFGDRAADTAAHDALARLFPGREVVQLDIDGIASGGGGIHCATQQQPAL